MLSKDKEKLSKISVITLLHSIFVNVSIISGDFSLFLETYVWIALNQSVDRQKTQTRYDINITQLFILRPI